jgi:hypothetical protein
VQPNRATTLEGKQAYDAIDTYGKTWEFKTDRKSVWTGFNFLEHIAIQHSQADYFIIFACGLTYILPRETVLELINVHYRVVPGGDDGRAGTLVPLSDLNNYVI